MKRKYLVKDRKMLQALSTLWHTRIKIFAACCKVARTGGDYSQVIKQFKMTKGNELHWTAQINLWIGRNK